MVKLQKHFAYKYKDKDHYKYVVTLPSEAVNQLGWKPETELAVSISNKGIVLKPQDKTEIDALGVQHKRQRSERRGEPQKE